MTEPLLSFAERLKALRHEQRLTKSAFARDVGVTPTCVWNWEEGNSEPRIENLRVISEVLGAPMDYLQHGRSRVERHIVPDQFEAEEKEVSLAEVIAEARIRIATRAGISPDNVSISLQY